MGTSPFEAVAAANALSHSADKYANDEKIEVAWAIQAYDHAEVHFDIITSVNPKFLNLSEMDDEIYKHFRSKFPDLSLDVIEEGELKSAGAKEVSVALGRGWRVQFLAIEIARNREGYNDFVYQKARQQSRRLLGEKESSKP